jgi:hypothetical protein
MELPGFSSYNEGQAEKHAQHTTGTNTRSAHEKHKSILK